MVQGRYFSLLLYKAYADLRAESEKYYMSYLWWLIEPLLHMCVYYVVFGILFQRGTEDYISFLLVGLVTWRWWTAIVNEGSFAILQNQHLIRQVYIPKFIFPTVSILTQSFKFSIVFSILLLFLWTTGYYPSYAYFGLPFLFLLQIMMVTGVAYFLAALFPYLPDLRLAVDTSLRVLFFLSGVFYEGSSIPEKYHTYFYLNPLARLLEGYRDILLKGQWPDLFGLVPAVIMGCIGILIGLTVLNYNDKKYAKVIR